VSARGDAPRVVVIGGGAAGTAAACAAHRAGAEVTLIVGRPGATSLTSGALDSEGTAFTFRDPASDFAEALGIWELAAGEPCRVATVAGILRPAHGRDIGVLDLGRIEAGVVAVVRAERAGWDAGALARAWSADPWAVDRGVTFEPVDVGVLHPSESASMPDVDLALRHDAAERATWLADQLAAAPALVRAKGILLGPWLGIRRALARELSSALGKPVGEPLSLPGGVAGRRFEVARDALLSRLGIPRVDGDVEALRPDGAAIQIALAQGATHVAQRVVLATGGLVGGGIAWVGPPADGDETTNVSGFVGLAGVPAAIGLGSSPLVISGSPEGALFEPFAWTGGAAWAGMERVGVWTAPDGSARAPDGQIVPWLFCAGDAVAGAPRTMLHAIVSGLSAGRAAARALAQR
jgi:FAD binding domain